MKKMTKKDRAKKLEIHYRAQRERRRRMNDPNQKTYYPKFYFAYGSNLNLDQMRKRCPTAKVIHAAVLTGWKLVFRNVADIVPGKVDDIVYGAVFRILADDERGLDVYEGYPHLYVKKMVNVRLGNGDRLNAMVYVMKNKNDTRRITPPNDWYFQSIHDGFADWKLPHVHLHDARKHSHALYEHEVNQERLRLQEEEPTIEDFIEYVADSEDRALMNWARNLNRY